MRRGGRLSSRLGLDGNSLRRQRRTDKIAAYGAAGLLALFLAGAPAASLVAEHWAYRAAASELQDQRAWRQVQARLTATAPALDGYSGESWTTARWKAPSGRMRTGTIPSVTGARAGSHVRIWVTGSGEPTGPPLRRLDALIHVTAEVAATPVAVALTLIIAGRASRSLLDRRRLAGWEAEWATVGPQWTRQFRARG